ncbi:hypothetical protein ACU686_10615 [Yinghuangia aomiensis]
MTTHDHQPPTTPETAATSAFAALLDRSLALIAEAAADARHFDRGAIVTASDVWDNNTYPLFHAASSSNAAERERRATAALIWMAALGNNRRRWMSEQAALAGHDIEALLPPAGPNTAHSLHRDYRGYVMPPPLQRLDDLPSDYDLAEATVRHVEFERAGTRLTAFVQLALPRTFTVDAPEATAPALLTVSLEDVTDAEFTLTESYGITFTQDGDGLLMSLGPSGHLRAARARSRLDDQYWHRSSAGRRADAVVPPRTEEPRSERQAGRDDLGPAAVAATKLLHWAMLEIRMIRYAQHADSVPITAFCRAFAGAGEAILAAGSRRRVLREAAFRTLVRTWIGQGGPALHGWFTDVLHGRPGPAEPLPAGPGTTAAPSEAALTLASYTARHAAPYRPDSETPASALVQFALPRRTPADPWRLRTLRCQTPDVFRIRAEAFDGPGSLVQTGKPTGNCAFDLHHGALHVAAPDGWSAALA